MFVIGLKIIYGFFIDQNEINLYEMHLNEFYQKNAQLIMNLIKEVFVSEHLSLSKCYQTKNVLSFYS